jgi:hypothetical protein
MGTDIEALAIAAAVADRPSLRCARNRWASAGLVASGAPGRPKRQARSDGHAAERTPGNLRD